MAISYLPIHLVLQLRLHFLQSTTMKQFFHHEIIATTKTTIIFLLMILISTCNGEIDPIQCSQKPRNSNCTITNSYGSFPDRSICRVSEAIYPTSEAELISAVAGATRAGKKMKAATRYSHSIPKLVCPDGDDGVVISTRYLNRTLSINVSDMTMTVESGVTLRQIINDAAREKLALPYTPYWWGLTVGGMMATGAHGSSLWGLGSQVHDYVIKLKIVSPGLENEGFVKVRTLEAGNPDLEAAKVSLGVLGVISQVTLKLQPLFKRSIVYVTKNDSDLGDEAISFGRLHEFADFTWYPSLKRVMYRVDDRVELNASGNGLLDFSGFRSTSGIALSTLRTMEEIQESIGAVDGKCISGKIITFALRTMGHGLKNDGNSFKGYPVIGYQNHIQASGACLDNMEDAKTRSYCPWDSRIKGHFFHQTTFSIALSQVKNFIKDVQKLVELEPKSMCGLNMYNGILMRYVTSSSAYLGKEEDSLDFDITYYRSKDPLAPRLFQDILEEIEQIAMFKYNALPHWGKNRNVAFQGAINKYKNANEFLRIKQIYDPSGLFSSDWTDQILGLKDGLHIVKEGCALEGLCICSQDIHCAPNKGYLCRPGKVYKDARVCVKTTSTSLENSQQKTFFKRNYARLIDYILLLIVFLTSIKYLVIRIRSC